MKLNLGCCDRHMAGYVNVDLHQPADVIADLGERWPWEDSTASEVLAYDIIEHLPDKVHTMNELWRVLEPDGVARIEVPTTDGRGAWCDPTHISYWNRESFSYYEDGNMCRERFNGRYGVEARFKILQAVETNHPGHVAKLEIHLRAVKSA